MPNTTSPKNINELWAGIVVDELARWGVREWFVSPGYRDVPMISALAARPEIKTFAVSDERSAAFRALAVGRLEGRPAALLCTSGTAGANYYPGIIEAFKDRIPLVVVTADRPFSLIRSGANQVIEQSGIFGQFVRYHINLPAPGPDLSPKALAAHCSLLAEHASGFPGGPVHLNIPFGEPLEPVADPSQPLDPALIQQVNNMTKLRAERPVNAGVRNALGMAAKMQTWLRDKIASSARPLLIVGRLEQSQDYPMLRSWIKQAGWPSYFDIGSQFLDLRSDGLISPAFCEGIYESYRPDLILHIGKRTVAKQFDSLVKKSQNCTLIIATGEQDLSDPTFSADQRIVCDEEDFARFLQTCLSSKVDPAIQSFKLKNESLKTGIKGLLNDLPFGFPVLAHHLFPEIQRRGVLILGNSTSVRAFDSWAHVTPNNEVNVILQRGVSGIEGHVSSGLGVSLTSGRPVTVVLGDIAFLHDLNTIADLSQLETPFVVIVANNKGGGIFRHMPIGKFVEILDPLVTTPHNWEFSGLAGWAKIGYAKATNPDELKKAYRESMKKKGATLIECVVDDAIDAQVLQRLKTYIGGMI